MQQMHKRVASVTPEVLSGETTTDLVATDTVIELDNSGDFYEDGGSVLIAGEVYTYSAGAVEEGEDDDAPSPSITLDSGLLADLPTGSQVEAWNPSAAAGAGAVVIDYMVEVTDDTDGSPGQAYLKHDLIPYLPEGLPPGVGDSVTVEVDDDGDWWVVNIHGARPFIQSSMATDTPGNSRVEVGEGSTFGYPAEEVRFYTGDAAEDGPAVINVSVPGGLGEVRMTAPNMSSSPPFLYLTSDPADSTSSLNQASLVARVVTIVSAWGPTLAIDSSGHTFDGEVTMVDVLNAVMESGSVGSGTFRDSVDARIAAQASAGARLFADSTATAAATAAKTVTIGSYVPAAGDTLWLTLNNGNTAASPTLNINGGGAKAIQLGGAAVGVVGGTSAAGTIWTLRYDGTVWHLAGSQSPHANTVAFAGLSLVADRLPYADGTGTLALATFTAAARALLDDANADAMLTTLGVSTFIKTLLDDTTDDAARATLLAQPSRPTINSQTGTTYTLVLTDESKVIQVSNAGTHTLTVPPNSSVAFATGTQLEVVRLGAGAVNIAAGAGVTITSRGGLLGINGQYGVVRLRKRAADTWHLSGDLV